MGAGAQASGGGASRVVAAAAAWRGGAGLDTSIDAAGFVALGVVDLQQHAIRHAVHKGERQALAGGGGLA